MRPGTILDVLGDTDYQFPASGLDAGRYVTVLQAELRAIASRLVMPEFMLTSDASNANYSSTMVAMYHWRHQRTSGRTTKRGPRGYRRADWTALANAELAAKPAPAHARYLAHLLDLLHSL
jgi:hypothetical protein